MRKTILPKYNSLITFVLSLCLFLVYSFSSAQNNQDFNAFADSIINLNIKDYNKLEYAIYKNKYDTLKMRTLEQKSIAKKYPQGEVFANIMLGNQYRNKSLFPQAEKTLKHALELSEKYNLVNFQIVTLNINYYFFTVFKTTMTTASC